MSKISQTHEISIQSNMAVQRCNGGRHLFIINGIGWTVRKKNIFLKEVLNGKKLFWLSHAHKKQKDSCGIADFRKIFGFVSISK